MTTPVYHPPSPSPGPSSSPGGAGYVSLSAPAADFTPPAHWRELSAQFRTSVVATLDSTGSAVAFFESGSANQRLVMRAISVNTNQVATATVIPWVTVALNTTSLSTMSQSNQCGTTNYGLINTFRGNLDVGQCDYLAVLFYPPPGSSAGSIALLNGVKVTAVAFGTKYTRVG